jgi:hypothetical protein
MNDFNRKVEDASARVSKTVAEAAERIEKEIPEFIKSSPSWLTTWSSTVRLRSKRERHSLLQLCSGYFFVHQFYTDRFYRHQSYAD